jgi:hypothetical protein
MPEAPANDSKQYGPDIARGSHAQVHSRRRVLARRWNGEMLLQTITAGNHDPPQSDERHIYM